MLVCVYRVLWMEIISDDDDENNEEEEDEELVFKIVSKWLL